MCTKEGKDNKQKKRDMERNKKGKHTQGKATTDSTSMDVCTDNIQENMIQEEERKKALNT